MLARGKALLNSLVKCHLTIRAINSFSRKTRTNKLILYSPYQIDKMAIRKQAKDLGKEYPAKPWSTTRYTIKKYRVSLVGLPNSGKSSLFNCLIGERLAIVDKYYGMTRDRKEYPLFNGLASLVDTPGVYVDLLKKSTQTSRLKYDIFRQTVTAIHYSDLILLVIDSKNPVSAADIEFSKYLKTYALCPIILICNKCDNLFDEGDVINEAAKLNCQTVFMCSAEYGYGVLDILNYVHNQIPNEIKLEFERRKIQRVEKFEKIVEKLKAEVKYYNKDKEFKIKEWEKDFRKINMEPANNESLDYEEAEKMLLRPEYAFPKGRGTDSSNLKLKEIIRICIIGRPNVGKSTLINELIGTDKMVVSSYAHTTRDAVRSKIDYKNRRMELIDTAGLDTPNFDRNAKEFIKKVQVSTMLHVQYSHVVIYVLDAFGAFYLDDFALLQRVIQEGRPLVIAVNKWYAVKYAYRYKAQNYLLKQLEKHLGYLHGNPLVFVSAKMQMNLDTLLDQVMSTYDKWNTRISTGLLNDWLEKFKRVDNLPKTQEFNLRINYMIQAKVRPPHFIFFVNTKYLFKDNYMRFLLDNLAKYFALDGIPLRSSLRSTNNRYKRFTKYRTSKKKSYIRYKMNDLRKKYANFGI